MPQYSEASKAKLATTHPDLQRVFNTVIKIVDITILEGLRAEEQQKQAVELKRSKVEYPLSKHNRSKNDDGTYNYEQSDALDCAPWPIQWPDIRKHTTKEYVKRMGRFYFVAGVVLAVGFLLGVPLRWGGHFKSFFDGPHFERVVK